MTISGEPVHFPSNNVHGGIYDNPIHFPWRIKNTYGGVYAIIDGKDVLIGMMSTGDIAACMVADHNNTLVPTPESAMCAPVVGKVP
jgi:hypothetical protein